MNRLQYHLALAAMDALNAVCVGLDRAGEATFAAYLRVVDYAATLDAQHYGYAEQTRQESEVRS